VAEVVQTIGPAVLFRALSGFRMVPQRPEVVGVWFLGGRRFADNAKALFLYSVAQHGSPIRAVWISYNPLVVKALRAEGLPAYHGRSLQGIWLQLRAGVYVFDCFGMDLGFWCSRGAVKVNLWHGLPLKKIQRDIDTPSHHIYQGFHGPLWRRLLNRLRAPWLYERPDLVIATAPVIQQIFASAFGLPLDQVPIIGYPRVDILTAQDYQPSALDGAICREVSRLKQQGRRIVAYLPTFRDSSRTKREIPLDWATLDAFLARQDAVLLLKLHSEDSARLPALGQYRNILLVDHHVDVYPLLRSVDVLITDYSSVWFDYLILDRPILFYAYDLEDYLKHSRSMYFDYEEVTPGPKVRTFQDLLTALEAALDEPGAEPWASARRRAMERFHRYLDDQSSARVWQEIYRRFVGGEGKGERGGFELWW